METVIHMLYNRMRTMEERLPFGYGAAPSEDGIVTLGVPARTLTYYTRTK